MSTSKVSTSKLSLNVAISKKKSNLVFAEAGGDMLRILVSFLKLPLGNIIRIFENHSGGDAPSIGSLTSLYKSSVHLEGEKILDISTDAFQAHQAFVEESATFIILDDLRVVPVVYGSIQTLNTLGITQIETAALTTVTIDDEDILDFLNFCLLSATPLTDLIYKKFQKRFCEATQESRFVFVHFGYESFKEIVLKILLQKSTGRFLLAEASDDFVKYLFRFLNVSVGGVAFTLGENPCFKNLENLNNSVSYVTAKKYLGPRDTYQELLDLQLRDTLRLISPLKPEGSSKKYIIRDDLTLEPSSLTSTFSILTSFGVPFSDVKEMDIQIGLNEALNIISASLSSTTVFTDVLINRMPNNSSKRRGIRARSLNI